MALGQLLDQIRAYYLERFRGAIEARRSEADARVISESPYFDQSGSPVREGTLNLPARGDLFVVRDGQVVEALQVDTEGMLAFEPLSFTWEEDLAVDLCPFQWNWCPFTLSPSRSLSQLGPLVQWFNRWFEERSHSEPPFIGVVHFLSDPEPNAGSSHLNVDLGSAPVEALEELLDACLESGASRVRVGDRPAA